MGLPTKALPEEEKIHEGAESLLHGMQNRVDAMVPLMKAANDNAQKEAIEAKQEALQKALEARKAPVTAETLPDAIDQIKYDSFLLEKISDGDFDQLDLYFLMKSDLMPFFDDYTQGQMSVAFEQMDTNDRAKTLLKRPELDQREEGPHVEKPKFRPWLPQILNVVNPDIIEKIKLTLQEARYIRTSKIREHLRSELDPVKELFESKKNAGIFSSEGLKKIGEKIKQAQMLLIEDNKDPAILMGAANNIQSAQKVLQSSVEEMENVRNNREAIEAGIREKYEKFSGFRGVIDEKQAETILEGYKAEAEKKLRRLKKLREKSRDKGVTPEKELSIKADLKKAEEAIRNLQGANPEVEGVIKEFEARVKNMGDIPPEELLLIDEDLNTFLEKYSSPEEMRNNIEKMFAPDNLAAQSAHECIGELETAASLEEIEAILLENLGEEHLTFVSHADFESNYREYTKKGHMVFYEKGDEWKIILDEDALEIKKWLAKETGFPVDVDKVTKKAVAELKKQLTHELLHLEFEKGAEAKTSYRQTMIEADPEQWKKVRAAFIKTAKATNKKAPDGTDWKDDGSHDDDILSELFAMQNEVGQSWSEGNEPVDELNNLLVGMGVDDNIKEKIRGYEEGVTVEAGEEAKDPSKAAYSVNFKSKDRAVYDKNKNAIDTLKKRIQGIKRSKYVNSVPGATGLLNNMLGYNDGTAEMNRQILNDPDDTVITTAINSRNAKLNGDLTTLENEIGRAAKKIPNNEIGIMRKRWNNTTFFSPADIVQMGVDFGEWWQRRHQRRKKDHAAQLGMAFFHGFNFGHEAAARQQKTEAEEVQEWQSNFENLDAWQLNDLLRSHARSIHPNKDQVKAILRILAKKGRLEWLNPDLWTILNKLQSEVQLIPGDQVLLHNPVLLRQNLHKALGCIYDYDEYTTLTRDNESAYESAKNTYEPEHNRMQDTLTGRLDELLSRKRAGDQVDPILYESILEYCIKNGKSNAENVMFHLIVGMAEGLLSPDRGLALDKYLNEWPPIEWFASHKPPLSRDDFRKVCEDNFRQDYEHGSISDTGYGFAFKNWYWTTVQNNQMVIDRVRKSVNQRKWDHDWVRSIVCVGDSNTMKNFLSGRSGQQEVQDTAVSNAYVGMVQWLEENSLNQKFANKKNFARMAGVIAMSEGVLKGTAYNRKETDISARQNESMNRSIPREAGIGRHGDSDTRAHRAIAQAFLMKVDPEFFGYLDSIGDARTDTQKKEYGKEAVLRLQKYFDNPEIAQEFPNPEEVAIDQIYDRLDLIVQTMFERMDDSEFRRILNDIAPSVAKKAS